MGWKVSESTIIEGYIDHNYSEIGPYALAILYFIYDKATYKIYIKKLFREHKWKIERIRSRIRRLLTWETLIITKPIKLSVGHHSKNYEFPQYEEFPF